MNLRPGKLPSALLAQLLATIRPSDPRVIVGPGIGRDAAVIDIGGGRVLVAKTDPITFATERIGWYAVHVNANDIACMGARPAWMLATALLPPGEPETLADAIFGQLREACASLDVSLVGGHTEVTVGLERAIVVGMMMGEASRDEIVTGESVEAGDVVLLTKGIAIEGTSLLAREFPHVLRARGVDDATIERARAMLFDPGISVVPEARAIMLVCHPRLFHDPTEGGIATALQEMAAAAGVRLAVDVDAIGVREETRAICSALSLDPLGLLASGALLAIIPAADVAAVTSALAEVKIASRIIGTVEAGDAEAIMRAGGSSLPLPSFDRDELARFYEAVEQAKPRKE